MSDLTDKPFMTACANPDGKTYNGVIAMQWLHEVMTGKPLSEEAALKVVAQAKQIAEHRKAAK
jgi:hypothetical protein